MATRIHPTALIDPKAELADGVEIGPYAIVDGPVRIGEGTRVMPYVHISGDTHIGRENVIHMGAVIGHWPQDLGWSVETPTGTRIGDGNTIREHVEVHRATKEGASTRIGSGNFLMAGSHVAHDCIVGDRCILANNVLLAGHVELSDQVIIAGGVPVHQFCRVGRLAMIGGYSACNMDVPPFMMLNGPSWITGVNKVGIRRDKTIPIEARKEIVEAHRILFRTDLSLQDALARLEASDPCAEVRSLIAFCRATKRGICKPGKRGDLAHEE